MKEPTESELRKQLHDTRTAMDKAYEAFRRDPNLRNLSELSIQERQYRDVLIKLTNIPRERLHFRLEGFIRGDQSQTSGWGRYVGAILSTLKKTTYPELRWRWKREPFECFVYGSQDALTEAERRVKGHFPQYRFWREPVEVR